MLLLYVCTWWQQDHAAMPEWRPGNENEPPGCGQVRSRTNHRAFAGAVSRISIIAMSPTAAASSMYQAGASALPVV